MRYLSIDSRSPRFSRHACRESAHGPDPSSRSPWRFVTCPSNRTATRASTRSPTRSTISNSGDVTGQLIARHWIITDANGHVEEVRGLAVVGHQPVLKPGESFEYTSWTRLATPHGTMRGTFFCMTEDAQPFDAPIGEFGLTLASALH